MKEVFSNGEHCAWLAQQLKNQIGGYVSFNKFGIDNPILTGVYEKNSIGGPWYSRESVRFYIKFCKGEFLRIQIDTGCNNIENIITAMEELIKALALIKQEGTSIGLPLAIYEINDCLTSEYAFKNQETIIESLKNNTMFDDGHIENLRLLRTCNNCSHSSFCADGGCDIQKQENDMCMSHEFEDGKEPNIKVLCKSICDNKR